MADLTYTEKNRLETLFGMGSGYVLDFSNRTFQEFVYDAVSRDIDDPKYNYASCSKANRIRQFREVCGSDPRRFVPLLSSLERVPLQKDPGEAALLRQRQGLASRR